MRACHACKLPLVARADKDGSGVHGECPTTVGREGYLAYRRAKLPGLVEVQERLKRGEHPVRPTGKGDTAYE